MIEKLGQFTPVTKLNRDELLFAAGRASARSPRVWKWLAGGLALAQSVTLAAWFYMTPLASPVVPTKPTSVEAPLRNPDPPPLPPEPNSYLELTRRITENGLPRSVPGTNETGPLSPPLTAGSRPGSIQHLNF